MMRCRATLPQLGDELFLTDGGIETTLIFHGGLDLPLFAAFVLLDDEEGTEALRRYYEPYLELARERGLGFVLESPTWRASPRWGSELGYSAEQLDGLNRKAIALMEELRSGEDGGAPIVISGCIGPQDDGYSPEAKLSAAEAQDYHSTQIGTFADTSADMVCAVTLTYAEEAVGIARAAEEAGLPAAISFTLETDGRLPSGQGLGEAIEQVDAETGSGPAYYMINCAHPTHFEDAIEGGAALGEADPRPARQRVDQEPRRAGRGRGARRGRSGRPRPALRRPAGQAAEPERPGRLLRHGPPARLRRPRRLVKTIAARRAPPPACAKRAICAFLTLRFP